MHRIFSSWICGFVMRRHASTGIFAARIRHRQTQLPPTVLRRDLVGSSSPSRSITPGLTSPGPNLDAGDLGPSLLKMNRTAPSPAPATDDLRGLRRCRR